MWDVNTYLCIIVMSLTGSVATENKYEFFQYEQVNFTCKHNKTIGELSKVQWKKGTDICATILTDNGAVTSITYGANCGLEHRANVTVSELTIFSMESYDDGEFSCIAENAMYYPVPTDTMFTVTIKVRPKNHRLVVNDKFYTCSEEITVDEAPNNSTLKCSIESKPQATFTWSTNPTLSGSLLNTTECVQDSNSLVYTCSNILTLPSEKVAQSGTIVVTCHVEAVGEMKDVCVKLVRKSVSGSANQLASWSVVYLICWSLLLRHAH